MKKLTSILLAVTILLSSAISVFAADVVNVKTLKGPVESFDILSVSNLIAVNENLRLSKNIAEPGSITYPAYICKSDFEVTLLQDVKSATISKVTFNKSYFEGTTGRTFNDVYVKQIGIGTMDTSAGSKYTKADNIDMYCIEGAANTDRYCGFGVFIIVDDAYVPGEGDILAASLVSETPAKAEEPTQTVEPVQDNGVVTATPTTAKVILDQDVKPIEYDAYNINGNNYFKLRDIAFEFTAQNGGWEPFGGFEVTWDASTSAVNIIKNTRYTSVGGELTKGLGVVQQAIPSTCKFSIDGTPVQIKAYTINDNNYIMLRDLCKALDYCVLWNEAEQIITVCSQEGYYEED